MKFGLVNGQKREATKGATGICPSCGSDLIARCGPVKINHWAHRGIRDCDPWWEPETEWHRAWKDKFPPDWQEFSFTDEVKGEKHRADIRTDHGLVIEFQHSAIDPQERMSRERFYGNMVWVVDGTRLKKDFPRFLKRKGSFYPINQTLYRIDFADECFPTSWLGSPVPVIFDFRGIVAIDDVNDIRNRLYCLFPIRFGNSAILADLPRESFINAAKDDVWSLWVRKTVANLNQVKQEWQNQRGVQLMGNNSRRVASKYIIDRGHWKKRRRF